MTRAADDAAECERLRAENARLIALLRWHGIAHAAAVPVRAAGSPESGSPLLSPSTGEKVGLFRRLFRGRADVYAVRWEGRDGRSGYAPACANEWKPGVCQKPRIKCAECGNRRFIPLDDRAVYDHLAGKLTLGVYPLAADDTCRFLAIDFDEAEWREDARALMRTCRELGGTSLRQIFLLTAVLLVPLFRRAKLGAVVGY